MKLHEVFLVYDENHGLRMVCGNRALATFKVREIAELEYGFNVDEEPLDYSGALSRYGWDGVAYWQKEIVYG